MGLEIIRREALRKLVIAAVCSDDVLMNKLVLKGGAALDLVHGISGRSSNDIDFSMEEDFDDLQDAKGRLERALKDRLDSSGFILLDLRFGPKPSTSGTGDRWGGYLLEFKMVSKT